MKSNRTNTTLKNVKIDCWVCDASSSSGRRITISPSVVGKINIQLK
jgi:hypothetical protein